MCHARRPLPTCLNLSRSQKIPLATGAGYSKPKNILSDCLAMSVKSSTSVGASLRPFISLCHYRVNEWQNRVRAHSRQCRVNLKYNSHCHALRQRRIGFPSLADSLPLASPARQFVRQPIVNIFCIGGPQSDRITPIIRTDVIEVPWPPYVAE